MYSPELSNFEGKERLFYVTRKKLNRRNAAHPTICVTLRFVFLLELVVFTVVLAELIQFKHILNAS